MEIDLKELNFELEKILTEVRYDRSLLFEEVVQLNRIAKGLKTEFGQYSRNDKQNSLILKNPNSGSFANIGGDRTAVDVEFPKSYEDFKSLSVKTVESVVKHLEVDEFNRVGVRFLFAQRCNSLDEASSVIKGNFLDLNNMFMSEKITAPKVYFVVNNKGNKINVSLRVEPVTAIRVGPSYQEEVQEAVILFDIDVYQQNNLQPNNINDFLDNSKEDALDLLKSLRDKMSR
ncbi:TIGR04255 family protein [Alteribacter populi]|uniref:TIGR04255 family protein n=1 Tax=Alteribacter populi TaxID=2011011 RepID=UPI000BBB0C48|nr:TIGR04255 family protein [Alteribacter populi]